MSYRNIANEPLSDAQSAAADKVAPAVMLSLGANGAVARLATALPDQSDAPAAVAAAHSPSTHLAHLLPSGAAALPAPRAAPAAVAAAPDRVPGRVHARVGRVLHDERDNLVGLVLGVQQPAQHEQVLMLAAQVLRGVVASLDKSPDAVLQPAPQRANARRHVSAVASCVCHESVSAVLFVVAAAATVSSERRLHAGESGALSHGAKLRFSHPNRLALYTHDNDGHAQRVVREVAPHDRGEIPAASHRSFVGPAGASGSGVVVSSAAVWAQGVCGVSGTALGQLWQALRRLLALRGAKELSSYSCYRLANFLSFS